MENLNSFNEEKKVKIAQKHYELLLTKHFFCMSVLVSMYVKF